MNKEDLAVVGAMREYGGTFVKQLALAALCADSDNLTRIKQTWPEYWAHYKDLANRINHGPDPKGS